MVAIDSNQNDLDKPNADHQNRKNAISAFAQGGIQRNAAPTGDIATLRRVPKCEKTAEHTACPAAEWRPLEHLATDH